MVAGATGVDLFLLVVAADDGVMPQTVEHVAILELFGVRCGVVALTKADIVDDEMLELVRDDVREFLAGTSYRDAPLVAVSSRDGRGIPDLLGALEETAASVAAARHEGPARLPIDRVFPLKGIGTVVTGTLWRGRIRAGDQLVLRPGERGAAVRSVQVHDRAAEEARAGQRVGVNLRGFDRGEVVRGDWLVAPSAPARALRAFDVWITLLPSARRLRSGAELRLHHGTGQHVARLTPLGGRALAPGQSGPARVRLDDEAVVEAHDRVILRALSPVETVGGAVVLDAAPRRWHDRTLQVEFLTALHEDDAARAAATLARVAGPAGVGDRDLLSAGLSAAEARAILDELARRGELEALDVGAETSTGEAGEEGGAAGGAAGSRQTARRWFAPGVLDEAAGALRGALRQRAAERPERPFMSAAELATAAGGGMPPPAAVALVRRLVTDGGVIEGEGGFASADAAGALTTEQEVLAERLREKLRRSGSAPPTLASLEEELHVGQREVARLLDVLVRRGDLVRAKEDLWFAAPAVEEARSTLRQIISERGQVTLAEFRDAVGTGRRNAQALLELFDREGLTRRQGDVRVLRARR